jgi:predicted RNA-binding protein YlqC (UPF0109 family)
MSSLKNMIEVVVCSIIDNQDGLSITEVEEEKGVLFQIQVSKGDTGKLIGKGGRIASALRTIARAAGAKEGRRVMLNVHKDPLVETTAVETAAVETAAVETAAVETTAVETTAVETADKD